MDINETFSDLLPSFLSSPPLDFLSSLVRSFALFLYIVDPEEHVATQHNDKPDIYNQTWPYLLVLLAVEQLLVMVQGRERARLNDTLTSLSLGAMQECGRLLWRGAETCLYAWLHRRVKVVDPNWSHPAAFYTAALLVDFCYYWVHRACHEVHMLWAQHQVHHSSEQMNVAVGTRQSFLQGWCGLIVYLPLAPLLPTHQLLLHQQVSLLYQTWLHTEVVGSLGPLEYIFNTPTHHRVHHGSNKYCLDKNYGGFLIIWDRLFGTFAEVKDQRKIVYGLVFNQPSFNPLHLQTFYIRYVWKKVREAVGWRQKLASVFYGPSWTSGSPRLGWEHLKIDVQEREKYDVVLPAWLNMYIVLQFALALWRWKDIHLSSGESSATEGALWAVQVLWTLTCVGVLLDGSRWGPPLECTRVAFNALLPSLTSVGRFASILTAFCWLCVCIGAVPVTLSVLRRGASTPVPPRAIKQQSATDSIYGTTKLLPVL